MATKTDSPTVEVKPVDAPIGVFDLSLDEFCTRLSASKISPEMIGGFRHSLIAAGRIKDSTAAFDAAFVNFASTPA